jgi:formylglycine-generating enzyme required for sulfatase activity
MVRVAHFCVDRYEASLVQADGRSWSPFVNPGNTWVRAVSVRWAVPQGYVSGDQAREACAHAGKRLCQDSEWLRACRGPDQTMFPYGDKRLPGVCNDQRDVHPAAEYYGTRDPVIFSHLQNPCLNQLPESLDRTGARAECVTAEGVFDMMGNVHEWTADPRGTFRGGYYVDTMQNGSGCLYVTTAHHTAHWDYSTGFRCCADP